MRLRQGKVFRRPWRARERERERKAGKKSPCEKILPLNRDTTETTIPLDRAREKGGGR